MDALQLIGRAGSVLLFFRDRFIGFLEAVLLLSSPAFVSAEMDLPERPADYLMDRGGVLSDEKARRISAALNACARDYDVHIYIVTVPTLNVMPSRAREKIDGMLDTAKSTWLREKVGAAIIFDHETGFASMGETDEARKVFSPVSINLIFEDPQLQYSRKIRASEQVERAATALIKRFSNLRAQANEEARRRRTEQRVFGGIVVGVVLLTLIIAGLKTRRSISRTEALESDSRMPADQ